MYRVPVGDPNYSMQDFSLQRRAKPKVLDDEDALAAIKLRMKHVVDECPQRNVIFEVESDISEDALVKVIDKLTSKFAEIDVIIADGELHHLVAARLKKDLRPTTVETKETEQGPVTRMTGNWSYYRKSNDYSLTMGTLGYFMRMEFERDVKEEMERQRVVKFEGFGFERVLEEQKEEKKQKRVAVLYRTESMLDEKGIIDSHPVDTVEMRITPLICQVLLLVDDNDDEEVLRRLREFIKGYSDRWVHRFLDGHLVELIGSARTAKKLVHGTHFEFVRIKGHRRDVVVISSIEREHLAIRQFLQLHYGLAITPLRVATLKRSPLHLLKAYGKLMGVFRRGGYELREWIPFMTQLQVFPSRVYPCDKDGLPVTPIICEEPSRSIDEWTEKVEKLWLEVKETRRIPQNGVRLVVCPSTDAMLQLWRLIKYSHSELVQATLFYGVGTATTDELEHRLHEVPGTRLITVLTTAAHFETWHTRYLPYQDVVTVYLGTPSKEEHYLHRAYRFARPIKNVLTVPLDLSADHTPDGSGIESGGSKGVEEKELMEKMVADAISKSENRSLWQIVFAREMWEKGEWLAPLSCAEDDEYEKCVEWMRKKWRDEPHRFVIFDEWRDRMMEQYRRRKE